MQRRKRIIIATAIVLGMAVYFDFFGVKALPAEPPAKETAKYVIPEENLEIPEEIQACAETESEPQTNTINVAVLLFRAYKRY